MDELILAGAVALAGLYAAAALFCAGIIGLLYLLYASAVAGDLSTVAFSTGAVLLVIVLYAGTGFWLRRTGKT